LDATGHVMGQGVVVAFSKPIEWDSIHHPHVFHVLVRGDLFAQTKSQFDCRCMPPTPMVAVTPTIVGDLITKAFAEAAPDTAPPSGVTHAVALLFDPKIVVQLRQPSGGDIFVQLRGDFVIDTDKRAIDAEFVRAQLPTGDRPAGAKPGIQGGTFESWFTVTLG
jgi:hypothetical protein